MKNKLFITLFAASASIFAADVTDSFDGNLWKHWHPSTCKVQFKKNLQEGIKDTPCAEIVLLPGNPADKSSCFIKKFPVTSGKKYQAVVMAKNAVAGKKGTAILSVQAFNNKDKYVSTITSGKREVSGEWTQISCTFTVPQNIPTVMVLLNAKGDAGCRILFDDFVLKELIPGK